MTCNQIKSCIIFCDNFNAYYSYHLLNSSINVSIQIAKMHKLFKDWCKIMSVHKININYSNNEENLEKIKNFHYFSASMLWNEEDFNCKEHQARSQKRKNLKSPLNEKIGWIRTRLWTPLTEWISKFIVKFY